MAAAPTADTIVQATAEEILSGGLRAGDKLDSERELATRYGVGRPLIREALRSLAELGLIETQPGRGTFVRAGHDAGAHRQADISLRRRGVTARQLSEARILLESGAARYAAARATDEDIEHLETCLRRLDETEGVDHVRADLAFHLAVAASAHNPVIQMMLESIGVPTVALMLRSVGDPKVMRRSQPYHRAVLDGIRNRDPDASADAMREHLTVAQELYGKDYERSVDSLAQRALGMLGARTGLDDLVSGVLAERGG
jgi:GntR family transcriptional repressor for pyruvate dehydrogenase complex